MLNDDYKMILLNENFFLNYQYFKCTKQICKAIEICNKYTILINESSILNNVYYHVNKFIKKKVLYSN